MRALTLSVVGWPLLSRAGVKRARLRMIRQVAVSSAVEPLDDVTVQLVTRPSGPTVSRKPVVPCSSRAERGGRIIVVRDVGGEVGAGAGRLDRTRRRRRRPAAAPAARAA